jgi:hypothetical protein
MGTAQRRLTHKGHIMETPEGELLLVNENGVAYRVNESVIAVWSLFEDKTVDEVVEEVSRELQIPGGDQAGHSGPRRAADPSGAVSVSPEP